MYKIHSIICYALHQLNDAIFVEPMRIRCKTFEIWAFKTNRVARSGYEILEIVWEKDQIKRCQQLFNAHKLGNN